MVVKDKKGNVFWLLNKFIDKKSAFILWHNFFKGQIISLWLKKIMFEIWKPSELAPLKT